MCGRNGADEAHGEPLHQETRGEVSYAPKMIEGKVVVTTVTESKAACSDSVGTVLALSFARTDHHQGVWWGGAERSRPAPGRISDGNGLGAHREEGAWLRWQSLTRVKFGVAGPARRSRRCGTGTRPPIATAAISRPADVRHPPHRDSTVLVVSMSGKAVSVVFDVVVVGAWLRTRFCCVPPARGHQAPLPGCRSGRRAVDAATRQSGPGRLADPRPRRRHSHRGSIPPHVGRHERRGVDAHRQRRPRRPRCPGAGAGPSSAGTHPPSGPCWRRRPGSPPSRPHPHRSRPGHASVRPSPPAPDRPDTPRMPRRAQPP